MTTSWAHLPNAKHIDRILADSKKNINKWYTALESLRGAAWSEWDIAWDAARAVVRNDANDARVVAWNSVAAHDSRYIIRGAILALIAWDDCAYLLDEKPEDVLIFALLGNRAAVLLYPACVALQKEMA